MKKTQQSIKPTCYLCGKELVGNITKDHIIPDGLFSKNNPNRPKLTVHKSCNSSKSMNDQWFIKQVQIRSSNNPEAMAQLSNLMDKAIQEKPQAYLIGSKLYNYKFARGIFDKVSWGLELQNKGKRLIQLKMDKESEKRFYRYAQNMCRGLFILNLPNSNPSSPELVMMQYEKLDAKDKLQGIMNGLNLFVTSNKNGNFGQRWADRILYVGSRVIEAPNKGYLFIQFYSQFGILAFFK